MNRRQRSGARLPLLAKDGKVRTLVRALRHSWRILRAGLWRRAMRPEHVIGVTGSCGKTTTVGITALVLSTRGKTLTGIGYNTAPGIASRVLEARPSHKFWVHEVSGHQPGAVAEAAAFIRPDIAIVTAVGLDHYKNYRSREAVAEEKGRLVESLPAHGTAILNADDPFVLGMAKRTRARVVTFGRSEDADIRLLDSSSAFPERLSVTISDGQEQVTIRTQLVGDRWAASILAAVALGRTVGIALEECARAVEAWPPFSWRDSVHAFADGATVIADTEKAPHWTLPSSIDIVRSARANRKTMVVGTISDYAGTAQTRYTNVAREALAAADRVIFVGYNSSRIRRILDEYAGRLHVFDQVEELNRFLRSTVVPGELIYLKGSIGDHLERIVFDQKEPIACWVQGCGIMNPCTQCKRLYSDGRKARLDFDPRALLASSEAGVSRA